MTLMQPAASPAPKIVSAWRGVTGSRGHGTCVPAPLLAFDPQGEAEALGQVLVGEHLIDLARGDDRAPAQQHRVGEPLRHLFDVVRDQRHRRCEAVDGQARQSRHEILAAAEVEAGGGLVQQEQLRVGHEGAGERHARALAFGERGEAAPDQVRAAERVEKLDGTGHVRGVIFFFPPADDRVRRREDQVEDLFLGRHLVGHRRAGQPDAGPQLEHIGLTELFAQDLGAAFAREQHRPGNLQQRRLSRAVRTDDHPSLVLLHGPVDVAQQRRPLAPDLDALEPEYLAGHRIPSVSRVAAGDGAAGLAPGLRHEPTAFGRLMVVGMRVHHPSAALVAWGNAWLTGHVGLDEAVDAVERLGGPHVTAGLPEVTGEQPLRGGLATLRVAGLSALRLALPAPGDPLGLTGPPDFNTAAIEAEEAVLATVGDKTYGLIPAEDRRGSSYVGTLWTLHETPSAVANTPLLPEADHRLTLAVREATESLMSVDGTMEWRPEIAEALGALRESHHHEQVGGLAPGYPARAHL